VCLAEVEAEESVSLKQLQALVSIACEYLGLWKILCDHQFHVIAGALTPVSLYHIEPFSHCLTGVMIMMLSMLVFIIVCLTLFQSVSHANSKHIDVVQRVAKAHFIFASWSIIALSNRYVKVAFISRGNLYYKIFDAVHCLYSGWAEQPSSDDIPDVSDIWSRHHRCAHQASDRPVHLRQCSYGCHQFQTQGCLSFTL